MDMEKSASRFKFFDTARNFGCIFFVKMENWHIGRDKESLVFTKKGRKIMRKIKRKKKDMQRKDRKNIYICIKYFDFLASCRFAAAFLPYLLKP